MLASAKGQKPSPDEGKTPVFFSLATVCAFPFVILSGFGLAAILTKRSDLFKPLVVSVFFTPILLVVAFGGLICIVLAWKKHPRYRLPLPFYLIAIVAYWTMLKMMGPW
jgi:hypothetical protein